MSELEAIGIQNTEFDIDEFNTLACMESSLRMISARSIEADTLEAGASGGSEIASHDKRQAEILRSLANEDAGGLSRISQSLREGRVWQISSAQSFQVIVPYESGYQTNVFHASFFRRVGDNFEILDRLDRKIVIPFSKYSREKYPLAIVDESAAEITEM